MKPWDEWKKPWSKEQCEMRYVQGDRISVKDLSIASGRSHSVVSRWAVKNDWVKKRDQHEIEVRSAIQQKTIEKTAEAVSDQLSEIAIANYRSAQLFRDYSERRIKIYLHQMDLIEQLPEEEQLKASEKHLITIIDGLSKVNSRAIADIQSNTGLKYGVEINAAIEMLIQKGFIVMRPSEIGANAKSENGSTTY